jgi:hypothetical protein
MKKPFILFISFLVMNLFAWPKFSYAEWGRHGEHRYYHYHDHPHYGLRVDAFYPEEYYPVSVGGTGYYYDDGVYYNYAGGGYVVVAPPMGVVVNTIPDDFQPVVINGVTYYADNGTYYVHTPSGYKVVSSPRR